ncbi:MAG: hypothetical protein AB1758_03465 [Candidatus Eremiobacterota bacterium]
MITALCLGEGLLAAGDSQGRVRLFVFRDGECAWRRDWIPVPGAPVAGLAFHGGRLWSLGGGLLSALDGPSQELHESLDLLALRGDLMALGGQGVVVLLGWQGAWQPELSIRVQGTVDDLDVSPDGQACLVVRDRRWVDVFGRDGHPIGSWTWKQWQEVSARFGPVGHDEVCIGSRGLFELHRLGAASGRRRGERMLGSAWLVPLAVSADGTRLAARECGQEVRVYDLEAGRPLFYQQPVADRPPFAGMSRVPVGAVEVAPGKARVTRWTRPPRCEGGGPVRPDGLHTALAVDGDRVAMGTRDGLVWLTDARRCSLLRLEDRQVTELVPPVCDILLTVTVRATGRQEGLLYVVDREGHLYGLEVDTGQVRRWPKPLRLGRPDRHNSRYFHTHGQVRILGARVLVLERVGLEDAVLRLCDLDSGRLLKEAASPGSSMIRLEDGSTWLYGHREHGPFLLPFDPERLAWGEPRMLPARSADFRGPVWAGGTGLVLRAADAREELFASHGQDSYHLYDAATGRATPLGVHMQFCPSFDGSHFALDSQIYRGPRAVGRLPDSWNAIPMVVLPGENLAFGRDTRFDRVVAGTLDGRVRVDLAGHGHHVWEVFPSTDRGWLISLDKAGVYRRWDLRGAFR